MALRKRHHIPTYRGLLARPKWANGSDVCRCNDSWLGAKIADQVIMREIVKRTIVPDEIPVCWPAAFRGAMHRLNTEFWTLNLERLRS